jgi:hypothetical protein
MPYSKIPQPNALRLNNSNLEVTVLPNVGAKIWELIHISSGFNFLWHNPRIQPQPYPIDANFDNYWCGGWDDGFPTCEPCEYRGEQYPALGELRSLNWTVDLYNNVKSDPHLVISTFGPINPVRARKSIRLREDSLLYEFNIENLGPLTLDFIWGTHPAFTIFPGAIIHIPAGLGIVGQATDPSLGSPGQQYRWPYLDTAKGTVDMSRVLRPEAAVAAGHYASELFEGWYAIENPETGVGILVEFPLQLCPYIWLWLTYGGWRGYYVAIVEPWTSFPISLSGAVAQKTQRSLAPREIYSCNLRVTPWASPETLASTKHKVALKGRLEPS